MYVYYLRFNHLQPSFVREDPASRLGAKYLILLQRMFIHFAIINTVVTCVVLVC